jgi:predicted DNA-binding transcriptional regulator AlpA
MDWNKAIKELLLKWVDNLDAGNSNINEETALKILESAKDYYDMSTRISKYKACNELGISRATFDKYVAEGKLPKGKSTAGFKELSWTMKDINDFKKRRKSEKV